MELNQEIKKYPYEALILVDPDTSEEEQKSIFKKSKEIVNQHDGHVHHVDTWGKRKLANPTKKFRKAIYFHSSYEVEPNAIKEIERVLGINDKVIRFIHTRLDEKHSIAHHMNAFKEALVDVANKEKEREAKFQKRRQARSSNFSFDE